MAPLPASILAIDDEEAIRFLIRLSLEKAGYQVTLCSSALEAMDLLDQGSTFDLILTDVMMPKLDGQEFAMRLHSSGYQGMILFVSGSGQFDRVRDKIASGEWMLLEKPFTPTRLVQSVVMALDRVAQRGQTTIAATATPPEV